MKSLRRAVLSILVLAWISYAQDAAPPGNQSSYPSETHKMTQKEKKSRTAIRKGMPVDLNTASKQDIAALPAVGPDYAQTIIDARPFASKEDLLRKKVIPQSTYDKIQNRVIASPPKKKK